MKQNKFNANKITSCEHCKQMLNMANKWIMPDEFQNWYCSNCGNRYSVKSYCEQNDGIFSSAQLMYIEINERHYKTFFLKDNKVFTEVSQ